MKFRWIKFPVSPEVARQIREFDQAATRQANKGKEEG